MNNNYAISSSAAWTALGLAIDNSLLLSSEYSMLQLQAVGLEIEVITNYNGTAIIRSKSAGEGGLYWGSEAPLSSQENSSAAMSYSIRKYDPSVTFDSVFDASAMVQESSTRKAYRALGTCYNLGLANFYPANATIADTVSALNARYAYISPPDSAAHGLPMFRVDASGGPVTLRVKVTYAFAKLFDPAGAMPVVAPGVTDGKAADIVDGKNFTTQICDNGQLNPHSEIVTLGTQVFHTSDQHLQVFNGRPHALTDKLIEHRKLPLSILPPGTIAETHNIPNNHVTVRSANPKESTFHKIYNVIQSVVKDAPGAYTGAGEIMLGVEEGNLGLVLQGVNSVGNSLVDVGKSIYHNFF
jgi:hypothetical protein